MPPTPSRPRQVTRPLPSVFFPEVLGLNWALCAPFQLRVCVVPTPLPRMLMLPAEKWIVFLRMGLVFSFSVPCLSFYFTPIFIPSTLQNKQKRPLHCRLSSADFFKIRSLSKVKPSPQRLRGEVLAAKNWILPVRRLPT